MTINGKKEEIEVFETIEFTSLRKRSSILIRHNGVLKFFMKGADNIVIEWLSSDF